MYVILTNDEVKNLGLVKPIFKSAQEAVAGLQSWLDNFHITVNLNRLYSETGDYIITENGNFSVGICYKLRVYEPPVEPEPREAILDDLATLGVVPKRWLRTGHEWVEVYVLGKTNEEKFICLALSLKNESWKSKGHFKLASYSELYTTEAMNAEFDQWR
jgi:hypothetical protein